MNGHVRTVAFCGNPNVGKSTLFNSLTGLHQHTGNWPGKTVGSAYGFIEEGNTRYMLVDLPGTYSLCAHSPEEEVARDYILNGNADAVSTLRKPTVSLWRNTHSVRFTEIPSKYRK